VKSIRVCLLDVLTTPRVGQTKIKGKFPLQKQKHCQTQRKKNRSSTTKVSYKYATGEKCINNLSNEKTTDSHIKLISRGLKFIPTNTSNRNKIRRQLLRDFEEFAR